MTDQHLSRKRAKLAQVHDLEEEERVSNDRQNKKRILEAFDRDGNSMSVGDPYRNRTPLASVMFDDKGMLTRVACEALEEIVAKRPVKPMCLAVRILVADRFAGNTHGNYSTIYLWR